MMPSTDQSIKLRCHRAGVSVVRRDVYFSFASGRFAYDCVSCQSKCCRGFGYELQGGTVARAQLAARPALAMFLDRNAQAGRSYEVQNLAPACFFLSSAGLCEIHTKQGHNAKPETCRIFPFNSIRRSGHSLVVDPHTGLCPLQILHPGATSDQSDHDLLYRSMTAQGLTNPLPEIRSADGSIPDAILREQVIRDLSESFLAARTYREFAAAQVALSRRAAGGGTADALLAVERFEEELTTLLGIQPTSAALSNRALVLTMAACTPIVRSHLSFVNAQHSNQYADIPADRLPHFLVAINTLAALAVDAGMQEVTYQTIMSLFGRHRALLTVLAYCDLEMRWRNGTRIPWPLKHDREFEPGYLGVVRGLLPRRAASGKSIGALLASHAPAPGPQRVVFLKQTSKHLAGGIATVDRANLPVGKSPLRSRIQRWALGNIGPSLLRAVAQRQPVQATGTPSSADASPDTPSLSSNG